MTSDPQAVFSVTRADGLTLSNDVNRLNTSSVTAWLASSYWAAQRTRDEVARSIVNSRPYGVYLATGEQIAFARVITDFVSFGWIADVIVDEAHRGKGIAHWMLPVILDDLRNCGLKRFMLATRDAHSVYNDVGFSPLRHPDQLLELDQR